MSRHSVDVTGSKVLGSGVQVEGSLLGKPVKVKLRSSSMPQVTTAGMKTGSAHIKR